MDIPNLRQAESFAALYTWINVIYFETKLPYCDIAFGRKPNSQGYFTPNGTVNKESGKVFHKITINPDCLDRSDIEIVSILARLMVDLWQYEFGIHRPSKDGYKNKEWTDKMKSIGLIPSDTGEPGGKQIGWNLRHYIDKDSKFELSAMSAPAIRYKPNIGLDEPAFEKKTGTRAKYVCPDCDTIVYGKRKLNIKCGICDKSFVPYSLIEEVKTA